MARATAAGEYRAHELAVLHYAGPDPRVARYRELQRAARIALRLGHCRRATRDRDDAGALFQQLEREWRRGQRWPVAGWW